MSSTLERVVEGFQENELEPLSAENLEIFIKHLRNTLEEARHLKLPNGIHGLVIYALLKETSNISAHACDFEDFTRPNLGFYQQCYGQLLLEIERA